MVHAASVNNAPEVVVHVKKLADPDEAVNTCAELAQTETLLGVTVVDIPEADTVVAVDDVAVAAAQFDALL